MSDAATLQAQPPTPGTRQAGRWLVAALVSTLAFRLWLAAVFPFTGDEAYFQVWGTKPDFGFYDHPPMVGWWLALLQAGPLAALADQAWLARLPSTLLPGALALMVWSALRRIDAERAALAACALLLVPVEVWNVFITTDTPLVLFSVASALAYWRAECREEAGGGARWHAAAGVLLGLALLSKYFAVLLAFAYVVHVLASPRGSRRWGGLFIVAACAVPFVAVNVGWNWQNCWANVMFNVYNRHDDAGASWKTPLVYAVMLLYVLSPVAMWQLWRLARQPGRLAAWRADPSTRFFAVVSGVPLLLFAALSVPKTIGLHWVLSFVPLFFCACFFALDARQLRASVRWLAAFALVHVVAVAAIMAAPLDLWKPTRWHDGIVFHFRIHDVVREMERSGQDFEFAADGYSPAVTLSHYAGRYVFVFGEGSTHARHDDIMTDFRRLAGRDILVFRKNPPRMEDYQPYFRSVEFRAFQVDGVTFHLVLGRGFDYPAYRDRVLALVRERYYRIPAFLPQGSCYFCERYFDAPYCPVRQR